MATFGLLQLACIFLMTIRVTTAIKEFNLVNNCPLSLTLYINGEPFETIAASGGTSARHFPEGWDGFFYTTLNQGNADGSGTVRAGVYGDNNYYYIVKDPNWLNVGMSIQPIGSAPVGGFCLGTTCEVNNCPDSAAFSSPPTAFPPSTPGIPPNQPLYQCPGSDTRSTITYCPSGTLPNYQTGPRTIQPASSSNKCLDVQGAVFANGTPVQIYDCNGTQAQKWTIKRGGQQIKLSGTSYCLDAGSNPASGVGMKIWQCYDNLPAQQWTYSSDNHIQLTGTGQCLDLTNGILTNGNRVQTWSCTSGNNNQVWNT